MAVEYWKKGEIEKLKEYCLQDVRVTRDVYEYALKAQEVRYTDRTGQAQTIPLPVAPPQVEERKAINLSLGF
jgi:DEAD/DEAH box helicase domain-containing protein